MHKALLTNVTMMTYQERGEEGVSVPLRFHIELDAEESIYRRPRVRLTPEWEDVDTGWLKGEVSLVVVTNVVEQRLTLPTPEEAAEAQAKTIELAVDGVPFGEIAPGCGYPFPMRGRWQYRSINGAVASVVAFPR